MSNVNKFDLESNQLGYINLTDGISTLFNTAEEWQGLSSHEIRVLRDGVLHLSGSYNSGDIALRIPVKAGESANVPEYVYLEYGAELDEGRGFITAVSAGTAQGTQLVKHAGTKEDGDSLETAQYFKRWKVPVHLHEDGHLYIAIEGYMYTTNLYIDLRGARSESSNATLQSVVAGWLIGFGEVEPGDGRPGHGHEIPLKFYSGWNEADKTITVPTASEERLIYLVPRAVRNKELYDLTIENNSQELVEFMTSLDITDPL